MSAAAETGSSAVLLTALDPLTMPNLAPCRARSLAAAINFDIKAFADTYPSEQPSGRSWKLFYFAAPDTTGRYKDFSAACELLQPC
jgi:hypothetical protein